MEKAVESFRSAILYNERHYNAWYGLGTIYYRQEKFELAECHFRRALAINPASSVLHCYLGALCIPKPILMYYFTAILYVHAFVCNCVVPCGLPPLHDVYDCPVHSCWQSKSKIRRPTICYCRNGAARAEQHSQDD